jgi:spermidine synthase
MYHVVGTALTAIILYIISYLFYRLDFFSFQFHRKLWNTLLALTFLATAAAGVFMALQVTYKWNIPFVKTILIWHVEFGTGMAFTGLFHLLWHHSYFRRIFEVQGRTSAPENTNIIPAGEMQVNLFITGLVSSSVQLLMLREMLNISGGYELITGIYLASWLIASAAGAALARRSSLTDIRKINLTFAFSPVLSVAMMFFLARMFLHPGETPSFLTSLAFTLLVLFPFCMVSGFTFIRLTGFARSSSQFSPGKSFSVETTGGVIAGIIIPVLTAGTFNTYELLLLIILLDVAYTLITFFATSKPAGIVLKFAVLITAITIILFPTDRLFRQILLQGVNVTDTRDTPYGNVTRGEYKGENSIYYDQRIVSYKYDITESEENIHYAMLQSDSPERVILISGSLASHLPEILKYPVREVTFIERDPELVREYIRPDTSYHTKLSIVSNDVLRFIRQTSSLYDVIILSVPPPSSLQLNRYYTLEFFREIRKKLRSDGIFMCSPAPGSDYFNKESILLLSSVYNSLKSVFKNVEPVAGNKVYLIASDNEISLKFCELVEKRAVNNVYVCRDYLSDDLIERKSIELTDLMDKKAGKNRNAYPVASLHFLELSFTKTKNEKIPVIGLLILIFAVPFLLVKSRNLPMYFSASALAGFELTLLLTLQLIVGNMYQLTGVIIASLMAGLAVGSGIKSDRTAKISLNAVTILLITFYALIGLTYNLLIQHIQGFIAILIITICAFFPAVLTGLIYNKLTCSARGSAEVSPVYTADLAGSALGFILISGFLLPLLGTGNTILVLTLMIFTGFLFGTIKNKL